MEADQNLILNMVWNGTTNHEAAYYNILSTELRYI